MQDSLNFVWKTATVFRSIRKIAKVAISFIMSVHSSICPHRTTRLPLDGFSWNL